MVRGCVFFRIAVESLRDTCGFAATPTIRRVAQNGCKGLAWVGSLHWRFPVQTHGLLFSGSQKTAQKLLATPAAIDDVGDRVFFPTAKERVRKAEEAAMGPEFRAIGWLNGSWTT